jgi:aromatic-L-amino-acid/L-tryptophan decarboxylase
MTSNSFTAIKNKTTGKTMALDISVNAAITSTEIDTNSQLLPTQTSNYQQAYYLRRTVSSMTSVAKDELCKRALEWATIALTERRAFRILSVGCGDGDLDLTLLQRLTAVVDVDFLGLEVNPHSAHLFQEAIQARRGQFSKNLSFDIRAETAEQISEDEHGFDLVLMSHVLYYFADPSSLVRHYLHQTCRIDGRLVIIHSGRAGIPHLLADVPTLQPFLCAEEIRDGLMNAGFSVEFDLLESELDATEILKQTQKGLKILGFCIERDINQLTTETRHHLLKALWSRCQVRNDGVWLSEPLAFMTLRNDLGPVLSRTSDCSAKSCDPIDDYHQLAMAFHWPARLSASLQKPAQLLDIGCGRGRWLKVLHYHWPELSQLRGEIEYSAIDPSAEAMHHARTISQQWASFQQGWTQKIEDIDDLPVAYYDLAWSMHALYCVSRADLEVVLAKIVQSLKPQGLAVIALPDIASFYITAAMRIAHQPRFTCAEDVCDALRSLGLKYEVRQVNYEEKFSAHDNIGLRKYVWEESIGNSFSHSHQTLTPDSEHLPQLPSDHWFESHRQGDLFSFPQNVWVITVRGGQSLNAVRDHLNPNVAQMRAWADAATQAVLAEHSGLSNAPVIENMPGALPPRWVHGSKNAGVSERAALSLFESVIREPLPEWGCKDLNTLLQEDFLPFVRHGTRDNAPGYMGFIPSGGLYLSAIAEWLAASFNRYCAMFMAAPGMASLEALSIRWLNEITGLQASAEKSGSQSGGLLVSGASLATVTAVHAARQKALYQGKDVSKLVAYFGQTAHCCVSQALTVCGITHQRLIPVLPDHRMEMAALSKAIEKDKKLGLEPFFIALSAGEVETGAVDDLLRGRAIADDSHAWLHIDGAYGGFFAMARSAPAELKQIHIADSLCLDPHKGLGLPYGTGALLVRDEEDLKKAFSNAGNYLPPQHGFERPPDAMDLGIEMTRPFRGLRLWLPIKLLGIAPFRNHLDHMLQQARWLANEIQAINQLELIHAPVLSIVTFRLKAPATENENRSLLDEINADGEFFLTGCTLSTPEGGFALRAALLSFRTDQKTVVALASRIRESVQKEYR